MKAIACVVVFVLSTTISIAQQELDLVHRDSLITQAYQAEQYAKVVSLVNAQLIAAEHTIWKDSVYQYCYSYARAVWKTEGVEQGKAAAYRFVEQVEEQDKDPAHQIAALGDLSWLLYEFGFLKECLTVDSSAMVIADANPQLSAHVRGKASHYVGFDAAALGDHAKAAIYFQKAVDIYSSSGDSLNIVLAESHNGLGSSFWQLGKNEEAEKHYLLSLDYLGDSEELDVVNRKASALGNLALLWEDAGNLTRSLEYAKKNIYIKNWIIENAENPATRDEAYYGRSITYANAAELYYSVGDHGACRKLLELAREDRRQVLEVGDPKLLALEERFADLERELGNYDKAEALVDTYLNSIEERVGRTSDQWVNAMFKKAEVVADRGEYARARSLLTEAIEVQVKFREERTDPLLARALLQRAATYLATKDSELALHDAEKAKVIYARIYGSEQRKTMRAELMECEALLALRADSAAHAQAIAILEKLAEQGNDSVGGRKYALPHLYGRAVLYKVMAARKINLGNAETYLLELERAVQRIERASWGLQDAESKLILFDSQQRLFTLAQQIAFQAYKTSGDPRWQSRLLSFSELNRSILLKGKLNEMNGMFFGNIPDSLLAKEGELRTAFSDDEEVETALISMTQSEQELQDLLDTYESEYPAYFELRYGGTSVNIEQIQKELLGERQTVVAFSAADTSLNVVLVNKTNAELLSVSRSGLSVVISQLNEAVKAQDMDTYLDLSHHIYEQVFQPITQFDLQQELLIIPDEELHYLNFEMLLDKASTPLNYVQHTLIQDYTFSYLLSATTALRFKQLNTGKASGVLALAPGFSDELKKNYVSRSVDSATIDHDYLNFIQQPFAMRTADELNNFFQTRTLLAEEATEENFKRLAKDHRIIHLGTHAELNNVSPMYSRLVMSQTAGADEDGYLHTYEIYGLELNAELAVLSACETGLGKQYGSEGIQSLAHGFAYAGCPSLVIMADR